MKSVDLELRSPFVEYTKENISLAADMPRPRLIKSHADIQFLPKQLWTKNPKIIYVVRDPRDVFVSFYHHSELFMGKAFQQDIETFIGRLLNYANFWPLTLSFYELRNRSNIMFFSYEEMKKNLKTIVLRVSKFLGKDYNEMEIDKLIDHLDFKNMKSKLNFLKVF